MDKSTIWNIVKDIPDPEIPVITIEELGVLRDVEFDNDMITVVITPTYSGCPAMKLFEDEIVGTLKEAGYDNVKIKTVFDPAWTTDWISDEAREKLRKSGIAPPQGSADKASIMGIERNIQCPNCGSTNTQLVSQFGSTACKALHKCNECLEPFDYFKCI